MKAAETFNTTEHWLGAAAIVLTIGTVISMSIQLKEQWNDLNDLGKSLNIINIAVTALSIVCNDFVAAAIDMAVGVAVAGTIECTLVTVLPIIGVVLAVIGLVIQILMSVFVLSKPEPPPKNPVEVFITEEGRDLVRQWDDPPHSSLAYSIPTQLQQKGIEPFHFEIKGINTSQSWVKLKRVTITFLAGENENSLFRTSTFTVVSINDITHDNEGSIYTILNDEIRASLTINPSERNSFSVDLKVLGTSNEGNPGGLIMVRPTFGIGVVVSGMIASQGTCLVQILEELAEPDDAKYSTINITKLALE